MSKIQTQDTDKRAPYYVGASSRFAPFETTIDCRFIDGSPFILSKGIWINDEKKEEEAYGGRWFSGTGVGYPNGRGYPQWMIVPNFIGICVEHGVIVKEIVR